MTYELGHRVEIIGAEGLSQVDWMENGQTGIVTDISEGYVSVTMDDLVDSWGNPRNFPFYEEEIKNLTEPDPEDTVDYDVLDTTNVDEYGIRGVEYSGAFEFFHKPTGKVLLVTEFVSLSTLIRLVEDHQEGNR